MSLSDRRSILLGLCALGGCGFTPVHGPGGSGAALRDRIQIAAPKDRDAYLLVRRLEERLGRASTPDYSLSLTIQTRAEGLGIGPDSNANRFNIIGVAGYVLRDLSNGQEVTSGTVNSFTGYSTTGSTVASLAAGRDARERLMVILADQITTRLQIADIP